MKQLTCIVVCFWVACMTSSSSYSQITYWSTANILAIRIDGIAWSTERLIPLTPSALLSRNDFSKFSVVIKDGVYSRTWQHYLAKAAFVCDTITSPVDCRLAVVVSYDNGQADTIGFSMFNMSINSTVLKLDTGLVEIVSEYISCDRKNDIRRSLNQPELMCAINREDDSDE